MPQFQNESPSKTFHMKVSLIFTQTRFEIEAKVNSVTRNDKENINHSEINFPMHS